VTSSPGHWREHLARCNDDKVVVFGDEFIRQWGAEPWPSGDEDRTAAAKLHVQLISRITTQHLPYVDGVEVAALTSIYQLFGEARDVFKTHPKCRMTDAVSWHVLNTHVRSFTAKWHRQSERGALAALDATDIFRDELATLQQVLTRFDTLLIDIRDDAPPPAADHVGETDRDERIAKEMEEPLGWGIDLKLGGLPESIARAINGTERDAVDKRRAYYDGRRILQTPPAPTRPDDEAARAETTRPQRRQGREHGVALAISGGGIRSATFALGVLVALARRNLLYQFDYLSTVSGGGYLGSFLTTFLNAEREETSKPSVGLLRSQLPFLRDDGEAAALRHVRHHSKYLATGRLWERLQMAFAQVYGMALNGLGFAYLALLAALAEWLLRFIFPTELVWPAAIAVTVLVLAAVAFLLPLLMRLSRKTQNVADTVVALPFIALLVLCAWLGLDAAHKYYAALISAGYGAWLVYIALVPLLASALLALVATLPLPIRIVLIVVSAFAAPLLFLGIELAVYHLMGKTVPLPFAGPVDGRYVVVATAVIGLGLFWFLFDINFTAPHRHYRKKLGQAYLVQPQQTGTNAPLDENVPLLLSKCTDKHRAPYHLVNCALNVPASQNPGMQGRLTDFFLFSPTYCGSPLIGYRPTSEWEKLDPTLDLGTAMAISGAAAGPQMGTGTVRQFSFWLALLNVRLGYWVRNPDPDHGLRRGSPPGLSYLLQEMFGWANEKRPYVNASDGGHIENLGVYELLRRRCKYIVAVDGEQDAQMTFQGLTTLQRLAAIDLGVTIDIGVDDLRLGEKGLSHSHFTFCRINYPNGTRDGAVSHGYLIYLKLSLTGNEGEFIRRHRLDEPAFPHQSTADQFFTEAQFEAYRSLGEHIGDKMFLPAIVGPDMARSNDVELEKWFLAIGKSLLEPLAQRATN
jgi:hypothetical protein